MMITGRLIFLVLILGLIGLIETADQDAKCNLCKPSEYKNPMIRVSISGQGKCPPGWKSFVRPMRVRVCLKIFYQNATYLEAQDVCRKEYNSRVHGVGTLEEHLWLKSWRAAVYRNVNNLQ